VNKKTLCVLLVFIISTAGLYAQQAGQRIAGARIGAAFGFNSSMDIGNVFDDREHSASDEMRINFALAAYGAHALTDRLSIQTELNLMINQGYGLRVSVDGDLLHSEDITYTSLDIPILLRYNFLNSPSVLGILAGPHVSIPIGRARFTEGGTSEEIDIYTVTTFGLSAGIFGGIQAGPGRIMGDLRFIFDFNPVEKRPREESFAFMQRRALLFTLGYEMSF